MADKMTEKTTEIATENDLPLPLDGKYGERPEDFMDSLGKVIYEANIQEARNQKLLWDFQDWKAGEESKRLSKLSRWIISTWEFMKLYATLRDGQMLCVDNKGKIFKGYVNPEKMQELPQRLPKRMPSNFDLAEFTYQKMVTKSVAEPAVVSGFKPQWKNTTRLANKNNSVANVILYFFMENWEETMKKNPEKCHLDITQNSHGDKRTVASIDEMSTKIVCNCYGNFVGFYYDGKYTKVW